VEERLLEIDERLRQVEVAAARAAVASANLQGSINDIRRELRDGFQKMLDRQDATNGRLRELERWRDRLVGAMSLLALLASAWSIVLWVIGR